METIIKVNYKEEMEKLIGKDSEVTNIKISQVKHILRDMDEEYITRIKSLAEHKTVVINKIDPINIGLASFAIIVSTVSISISISLSSTNTVTKMIVIGSVVLILGIGMYKMAKVIDEMLDMQNDALDKYLVLILAAKEVLEERKVQNNLN